MASPRRRPGARRGELVFYRDALSSQQVTGFSPGTEVSSTHEVNHCEVRILTQTVKYDPAARHEIKTPRQKTSV